MQQPQMEVMWYTNTYVWCLVWSELEFTYFCVCDKMHVQFGLSLLPIHMLSLDRCIRSGRDTLDQILINVSFSVRKEDFLSWLLRLKLSILFVLGDFWVNKRLTLLGKKLNTFIREMLCVQRDFRINLIVQSLFTKWVFTRFRSLIFINFKHCF